MSHPSCHHGGVQRKVGAMLRKLRAEGPTSLGPAGAKTSTGGSGLSAPSSPVPEVGSTGVEAPQAGGRH